MYVSSSSEMDAISLCWRGMAGAGKKTRLHEALKQVSATRGYPFTLQYKPISADSSVGDVLSAGATEGGAGPEEGDIGQMMVETSLVHIGLDISRMSMQDKHILRPILAKLGQGSQVLAGNQGHASRILVLYHTHLLSSESILLLQAFLEQNEQDTSLWFTSELPVSQRIRDWFIEIPVGGPDRNIQVYISGNTQLANWPDIFTALIDVWRKRSAPRLQEIKEVKAFVYEMLMRNLRWVEATHFLLDVILKHPEISDEQRCRAVKALASCEATSGGYTIPSYRIPILWENLFLQLRSIFYLKEAPIVDAPPRSGRVSKARKNTVEPASTHVGGV
jgi:hypothetical protein